MELEGFGRRDNGIGEAFEKVEGRVSDAVARGCFNRWALTCGATAVSGAMGMVSGVFYACFFGIGGEELGEFEARGGDGDCEMEEMEMEMGMGNRVESTE